MILDIIKQRWLDGCIGMVPSDITNTDISTPTKTGETIFFLIDITIDSTSLRYSNFELSIYVHTVNKSFRLSCRCVPFLSGDWNHNSVTLRHGVHQLLLLFEAFVRIRIRKISPNLQQTRQKSRGRHCDLSISRKQIDYGDEVIKSWWVILCFDFSTDLLLCCDFFALLPHLRMKITSTIVILIIICFMLFGYAGVCDTQEGRCGTFESEIH